MDVKPIPDVILRQVLRYDRRARNLVDTYNDLWAIYHRVFFRQTYKEDDEEYQAKMRSLVNKFYTNFRINITRFPQLVGETDTSVLLNLAKGLLSTKFSDTEKLKHSSEFKRVINLLSRKIGEMLEVGLQSLFSDMTGNINVRSMKAPSGGIFRGRFFRKKTDKENLLDAANQEDPESVRRYEEVRKELNEAFSNKIKELGWTEAKELRKHGIGELVRFARDNDGNAYAIKSDGTIEDFESYRKNRFNRMRLDRSLSSVKPENFQRLSLHKVTREYNEAKGTPRVKRLSLSDGAATESSITRTFPVVNFEGEDYVAQGRFAGARVRDLISGAGRMIEGSGYKLQTLDSGHTVPMKIEYKVTDEQGRKALAYRQEHEPYITYYDNQFLVSIPPGDSNKIFIREMKKIAKTSNSIKLQTTDYSTYTTEDGKERKRQLTQMDTHVVWSFDLTNDFETIAENLTCFDMSSTAAMKIKAFLEERKKRREAMRDETYKYTVREQDFTNLKPEIKLFSAQKQGIDFLLREGRGVVGLGIGAGKTATALIAVMKWQEDGTLSQRNGRFLVVTEKSLQGNFINEAKKIAKDPAVLLNAMDTITYDGFTKGKKIGEPFTFHGFNYDKIENYGAVIFDEAQAFKGSPTSSNNTKAIHSLDHPHKVLLTASLMEKSPVELFNLIAISKNLKPENYKSELKDFKRRFCIMGKGGVVLGIKQDRPSRAALADFVSKNAVSTPSTDANETLEGNTLTQTQVPPLIKPEITLTAPPELAQTHEQLARPILGKLSELNELYKNLEPGKGLELLRSFMAGPDNLNFHEYRKLLRKLQILNADPSALAIEYPNEGYEHLKNASSPKYDFTLAQIQAEPYERFLIWSDTDSVNVNYGIKLSREILKPVVVATTKRITFYNDGRVIKVIKDNFTEALKEISASDIPVLILGRGFNKGHNLQAFSRTIQLDLNQFDNETLKQRDGRNHRSGSNKPVVSFTPTLNNGIALESIANLVLSIQDQLFNEVVRQSFAYIPERDGDNSQTSGTTAPYYFKNKEDELRIALQNLTKVNLSSLVELNKVNK